MPVALTYPGVYVEEIPSGVHTITAVATSIAAFVGRAPRGPVNEATVITSFSDYDRQFGGLSLTSGMSFEVRDFFTNGGQQAVIVRLYHADPGNPAASPPVPAANSVAHFAVGPLKFVAADEGAWGANLRISVDQDGARPDVAQSLLGPSAKASDLFNLSVTDTGTGAGERYLNLTVKDSARRVDNVLVAQSSLARYDGKVDGTATVTAGSDALSVLEKALSDAKNKLQQDQIAGAAAATITDDQKKVSDATDARNKFLADPKNAVSDGLELTAADFVPAGSAKTGLQALEQLYARDQLFNLLCIPPFNPSSSVGSVPSDVDPLVVAAAAAYCEQRRAMLLVDAPSGWNSAGAAVSGFSADPDQVGTRSRNAALFFPRPMMPNPLSNNQLQTFAAGGVVAGIFARTDTQRGVWKAPAGIDAALVGVSSLSVPLTNDENGQLNPLGINCLRNFPVYGRVLWGSRTLKGADAFADEYKYVPVRRTALFIEESLYRGTQWVVFEPNDEPLWASIRLNVGAFMHDLFRQGAFQGSTPKDAYFVKCDKDTTTQNDIDKGIVNILVGFAPLKPAEFVVIQLQQMAGQIQT
ncbi:MAG: phage tail sheath family protein [Proteobacteria bacterium]|nr:phage tail sheath family protein [Pseudomonadota bacterium]